MATIWILVFVGFSFPGLGGWLCCGASGTELVEYLGFFFMVRWSTGVAYVFEDGFSLAPLSI